MSIFKLTDQTIADLLLAMQNDPDLADAPTWFSVGIAGMFESLLARALLLFQQLNPLVTEIPEVLQDFLFLLAYSPRINTAAIVDLTVTIDPSYTVSGSHTVPASDIQAVSGFINGISYNSWGLEAAEYAIGETEAIVSAIVADKVSVVLAQETNGEHGQEVDLEVADIQRGNCLLTIDGELYSPVDVFAYSESWDNHFLLWQRFDGTSFAVFSVIDRDGDVYGRLPPPGKKISLSCFSGGGIGSNVPAGSLSWAGDNASVISASNAADAAGGEAPEALDTARSSATIALTLGGQFIDANSGRAKALEYPGVLDAYVIPPSLKAWNVFVLPNEGGEPAGTLLEDLEDHLVSESPIEQYTVNADWADYQEYAVVCGILTNNFAGNQPLANILVALRSFEAGADIRTIYAASGIDDALDAMQARMSHLLIVDFRDYSEYIATLLADAEFDYQAFARLFGPSILTTLLMDRLNLSYASCTSPALIVEPGSGQIFRPLSVSINEIT